MLISRNLSLSPGSSPSWGDPWRGPPVASTWTAEMTSASAVNGILAGLIPAQSKLTLSTGTGSCLFISATGVSGSGLGMIQAPDDGIHPSDVRHAKGALKCTGVGQAG